MTDGHVITAEIERVIRGDGGSIEFEAHVLACERCARALAREANLELVLRAVAEGRRQGRLRVVQSSGSSRLRRDRRYLIGAALAAAASALFIFHSIRASTSIKGSGAASVCGSVASLVEPDGGVVSPVVLAARDGGDPVRPVSASAQPRM